MTSVQAIAALLIRIWAIEKFITSAFNIQINRQAYLSIPNHTSDQYMAMALAMSYYALFLVLAVVFFVFASPVVRFLLPPPTQKDETFRFSVDDMVRAGAFLMGLYLLGRWGPQSVYVVMKAIKGSLYGDVPLFMNLAGGYIGLLAHIFLMVFALWLIFRSGDVARLFAWFRTAGKQPVADPPAAE